MVAGGALAEIGAERWGGEAGEGGAYESQTKSAFSGGEN